MGIMEKGQLILSEGFGKNGDVYRGIMELMCRFMYVSIEELKYEFDLSHQQAVNRLFYLEKANLIRRFPSYTWHKHFFCLTPLGRRAARMHIVSDEFNSFNPERFSPVYERHQRRLIKAFLALRKILGQDFEGWITETRLREEMRPIDSWVGRRVFDGAFLMRMCREDENRVVRSQLWTCGIELEISLKSPARYIKQFRSLTDTVYERVTQKQKIPLLLFLYSTQTIFDRLVGHLLKSSNEYGRSVFVFGQIDEFLNKLGEASMIRYLGDYRQEIKASDFNRIQWEVPLFQ
jgi:hypothetical protein